MAEVVFPDYEDSILNLSCSILKHYGVRPKHSTLPVADEVLSQNFKHVVVILLDGFGMNIMEHHFNRLDFFRRRLLTEYSSVFPPTTTASTTSFLSGLSPIEHGWLGWDLYFKQEDKNVTCFKNTLQHTTTPAADYNIAHKYLGYENIIDKINNAGKAKAYEVLPFGPEPHTEINDWVKAIKKNCLKYEKNFTYAYWEDPDATLHTKGAGSKDTQKVLDQLNEKLIYLCEECPETLFFITADHGHTRIRNDFLEDYPEVTQMLERPVCIEPRAISFYVKPEFQNEFPQEFNKHFGEDYILYTKQEALDKQLFGPGEPHENLTGLGDYLAVATTNRTLLWNRNCNQFKSHHAGLTKEEMKIPLIWYENKPKKGPLIVYYSIVALIIFFLGICLFGI